MCVISQTGLLEYRNLFHYGEVQTLSLTSILINSNKGFPDLHFKADLLSVHPSINVYQVWMVWAAAWAKRPRPPSPQPFPPALPGQYRGFPKPAEIHNLSSLFWICTVGRAQNISSGGGPEINPHQLVKALQLTSLNVEEQRQCSEYLPNDWMCHLISKGEPSHTMSETNFSHMHLWSNSFSHFPQLITMGEGWNVNQSVNTEPCLLAQFSPHQNRWVQSLHYWICCTDPTVGLLRHCSLMCEPGPKTLSFFHTRQHLKPNLQRGILVVNHALRFGGADSHPCRFTHICKLVKDQSFD